MMYSGLVNLIVGSTISLMVSAVQPQYQNVEIINTKKQVSIITNAGEGKKIFGLETILYVEPPSVLDSENGRRIFSEMVNQISDPNKLKGFYHEPSWKYYKCIFDDNNRLAIWFVYASDGMGNISLLERVSIVKGNKHYEFYYGHGVLWNEWNNFNKIDFTSVSDIDDNDKEILRLKELAVKYNAVNKLQKLPLKFKQKK